MSGEKFKFFAHRACEHFPCHEGADPENFNCLFCWCPLYALGDRCGGHFTYTDDGVKDCSACLLPHRRQNYDRICQRFEDVQKLAGRAEREA